MPASTAVGAARTDRYGPETAAADGINVAVAAAQTQTVDVVCDGFDTLTVAWQLLGTVTPADLAAQGVKPYRPDGATLIAVNLPADVSVAPAASGANVVSLSRYNVKGLKKVRVEATNNNVASLTMVVTVFSGANPIS